MTTKTDTTAARIQDAKVTTVLLVDDHKLMLDCLGPLLEKRIRGLTVVGMAEDGTSAVAKAAQIQPDLVILDIDLPGMGSFDAAREIQRRLPTTRLMFLSAHYHDEYIEQAIAIGARGYVVKQEDLNAIVNAVERVISGELYYSPAVLERVQLDADSRPRLLGSNVTRLSMLTDREHQVLIMLAKGESVKRIATALQIAYKTVDKHKVSLMKKLGIHDRVELCRFAVRERLIEA